jgi:hypothetical protein
MGRRSLAIAFAALLVLAGYNLACFGRVITTNYAWENPLFKEILQSQLAFAKRTTQWEQDTVVSRKMAYDHYWGANGAAKKI